jgi:hypothetical protein
MSDPRNVLTIATGKTLYLDLAVNLARSFHYWNKHENINFYLATDMPGQLPVDVKPYVNLITLKEGELGHGFLPKLHLDKLAPAGRTLFIDSDCLVYGKLAKVFDGFNGHDVSVVGDHISEGEWFGNVSAICRNFGINQIPKFNGGIYYLEKGDKATAVFQKARELETQYDEIGFVRLRGRPNDEVIMALAMELNGQNPVQDDGRIMSDPQACRGKYHIDVIKGEANLVNLPYPHQLHQSWYPFHQVSPVIVHFLGYYTMHYPYKLDAYKLQEAANNNLNLWSRAYGRLSIEYPERLKQFLKDTLRPIFHGLFGARKVKKSERI